MHEQGGWLLDSRMAWIALAIWATVVLIHAAWRSLSGDQDPIRESGPIL